VQDGIPFLVMDYAPNGSLRQRYPKGSLVPLPVIVSSVKQVAEGTSGTLAYMAPEQIEGHPRPASDQYALGVVVYEWLGGERPFDGSVSELIAQQLSMPPPPLRERVPAIPAEVEQVLLRTLAKDPKARFASVQDFATALEQASPPALIPTAQLASKQPAPSPATTTSFETVVVASSQPLLPTESTPLCRSARGCT
jgi:eukaryotic-like serine/threonine-protein kinase